MSLCILDRLEAHTRFRPDAAALVEIDPCSQRRILDYADFVQAVEALANRLCTDCPPGAVVILCHPNGVEVAVGFFGCLAAGVTVFPVHPSLPDAELITAATRARAHAVIGHARAVRAMESIGVKAVSALTSETADVRRSAAPPALLLQSSGTTGTPKIVYRSGPSLDAVARNVATAVGLSREDRVLGLTPACHSYGVENVLLAPIWAGATVELCQGLDTARVMRRLADGGISVFPGVPTMFEMLVKLGDTRLTFPSLRQAYSAGASLPRSIYDAFRDRFGVRLGQLYGMTEIGSVTFNDPHGESHDPASVGRPMEGVHIRVIDPIARRLEPGLPAGMEGEIAVCAPSMLDGYLDDAVAADSTRPGEAIAGTRPPRAETFGAGVIRTAAWIDGYILTGDLGQIDERGRLTITGRTKLIVDVGGLKVNLLEVETVLGRHRKVAECAVSPVAVSETVSRLKAVVVPAQVNDPPSSEELRVFLKARLSAHKLPRVFEFRKALPKSATGKILRGEL